MFALGVLLCFGFAGFADATNSEDVQGLNEQSLVVSAADKNGVSNSDVQSALQSSKADAIGAQVF